MRYKYNKSANIIHAYSPNRGSCKTLQPRINNNVHARYVSPSRPKRTRTEYNISTRTLIAQSRFGVEILQDSYLPKQASINAFYVIAFLRCRSQRLQFNVAERDVNLSYFACLQLRLEEGEDISGTLVIKCGIILQQALVCI